MTGLILDYNRYFGFRYKPFDAQNAALYFSGAGYGEAYQGLLSGLRNHRTVNVLSGTSGTGKSLLLGRLIRANEHRFQFVLLPRVRLGFNDIIDVCCEQIGLADDSWHVNNRLQLLCGYLEKERSNARSLVLVIDDADRLNHHELTAILSLPQALGNSGDQLRLLLAGTFRLGELVSRIVAGTAHPQTLSADLVYTRLLPLTLPQAEQFIGQQLKQAGIAPPTLFSRPVIRRLHRHSRGVIGYLSLLCDHTLLAAQLTGTSEISRDIVDQVAAAHRIFDAALISRPEHTLHTPILKKLQAIEAETTLHHDLPLTQAISANAVKSLPYPLWRLATALLRFFVLHRHQYPASRSRFTPGPSAGA